MWKTIITNFILSGNDYMVSYYKMLDILIQPSVHVFCVCLCTVQHKARAMYTNRYRCWKGYYTMWWCSTFKYTGEIEGMSAHDFVI